MQEFSVVIYAPKILAKDLSRIAPQDVQTILKALEQLSHGYTQANVKRLQNYEIADFRLRVGNYRVLFNVDLTQKEIYILRTLHRSKLY